MSGLEESNGIKSSLQEDKCIEKEVCDRVRGDISQSGELEDERLREVIRSAICDLAKKGSIPISKRRVIENRVFNSFRKLGVLQEFLEDDDISEIMVNRYDEIFLERKGNFVRAKNVFSSEEVYEDVIQKIVGSRNKIVNETNPIVDTRLSDGSRANIVLKPIAVGGSVLTIRKFPKKAFTMDRMVELKSIDSELKIFLRQLVERRYNIFVSGGTSSGKTTFLNALTEFIPKSERVVCIEDSCELKITDVPNLVRLESRDKNISGKNEITIRDLVRTSLRMRPDRLIVGECRGAETLEMLQAFNTGHDGGMSTGHANSTKDMISRLEGMALMAEDLPLSVIRQQIAYGIDIMIHLERRKDGRRILAEISEVRGIRNGEIVLEKIVKRDEEKDGWEWIGDIERAK
ncbi:MAG: Flp pilus assembly complex ATPase component TadA [Lachnospiraceae bacterium]|nr:Flp pilus assembly complex ATPase component TadA [Lachnospiraceae bacterium]